METKRSLGSHHKSNESYENSPSPYEALRAIETTQMTPSQKLKVGLHSELSKHSSHLVSAIDGFDGHA